jgi:putative ABC transport system permease protein
VAVAIAARDFADRHLDDLRDAAQCLGQPQRSHRACSTCWSSHRRAARQRGRRALGFAVHYVFVCCWPGWSSARCRPPSAWPALFGVGVGFTLLMGFGLPPVLQLAQVPPLRVIRRDVGALKPASIAVLAAGALGFAALLLAVASDLKLGLIAVGGFAAAIALFALLSWIAVRLLRRAVPESRAPRWLVLAHAPDRGAPGLRGAAGVGAQRRPARAGAAGAAAHRPDRQLAPRDDRPTRPTAS